MKQRDRMLVANMKSSCIAAIMVLPSTKRKIALQPYFKITFPAPVRSEGTNSDKSFAPYHNAGLRRTTSSQ